MTRLLRHRDAWVEVDLDAIVANAHALASLLTTGARLAPVLKADAYGHGAVAVGGRLAEAGYRIICVATVAEGLALRSAGHPGSIIVLFEPPREAFQDAVEADLEIGIGSREGLRNAALLPRALRGRARFQLAIDTGMAREGLRPSELPASLKSLRRFGEGLAGIWTHLADGADQSLTARQLASFDGAVAILAAGGVVAPRHAAASAAILAGQATGYELARPGLALFGAVPSEYAKLGRALPILLQPAMAVRARPTRVVNVPRGTNVGYQGTFTTARRTQLATLPIGYADGLRRSLGNAGTTALVAELHAPVVGRVSMDSCAVDVTGLGRVDRTTVFTFVGRSGNQEITLEALSEAAGTIPQDLAVAFGWRLPVRYIDAGSAGR